jgi:hypothetical protein
MLCTPVIAADEPSAAGTDRARNNAPSWIDPSLLAAAKPVSKTWSTLLGPLGSMEAFIIYSDEGLD